MAYTEQSEMLKSQQIGSSVKASSKIRMISLYSDSAMQSR